ncbi:MAG: hypothetical protein RLZZ444_516 [Pseudomonadota bacterium]
MNGNPVLELVGVGRQFPTANGLVKAVDDITLSIAPGETIGIVGESGCGKSTLARIALRLIAPSFGRLRFNGSDLAPDEKGPLLSFRRQVQAIFQNPYASLNSRMSVRQILMEPMEIHRFVPPEGVEARLERLLAAVGMRASDLSKTTQQFSGGQLQRIAIARALVLDPLLVVADEPTSALDPSVQAQIVNLFLAIQRERNFSLMIISHDLDVVGHMADRIAVMYLGAIIEIGTTADLLGGPLHPYTQALLSAGPSLAARRRSDWQRIVLTGDLPKPTAVPTGCRFHPRCALAVDRCRVEAPVLRAPDIAAHAVACHLAPEETAARGRQVAQARVAV